MALVSPRAFDRILPGSGGPDLHRPPILVGYTYDPEDAYRARNDGRLLAIRLETNRSCNLRCRYCYAQSGDHLENELGFESLSSVIRQARDLGVESVVVIGGGEPTIHPRFRDLISLIDSLNIVPVVFTNTIIVTRELAEFLYARNVSVMGKLDSLRSDVQDFLAGCDGAFDRIGRGLGHLVEVGFTQVDDPHKLRLGVSFVSSSLNLGEIEDIWHYCRQRDIFPNMEILTPTGRAREELPDLGLSQEQIRECKLGLLDIDRSHYGYDWLPYTPLPASGCLQHLYSLYITIEGNVRPCAPTKFDENPVLQVDGVYPHNILRRSLREIYEDDLFRYVREIDRHLEGKCRACDHLDECIGCRGYAYSVGVNGGKDPYAALRGECLHCFR